MARLTYIAAVAILAAANSATGGEINPEAHLEAVASCFTAVVDGLLIQQWTAPEGRAVKTLKAALPPSFTRSGGRARMRTALLLFVLTLMPLTARAQQTPAEIVKAAVHNWRGESSYMEQKMVVHRPDWERETSMVSVTRGEKDALVRFTAPAKDAGNATLKLDQSMWAFTPRLNQVIKLPASMMAQSWMGSDFSYDDLAKSDRIATDYDLAFKPEEEVEGRRVYVIEAIPRPDAPVVWGREVLRIRDDNVMLERTYYDQQGALVRRMVASRIELINGQPYPHKLRMTDAENEDHWTDVLTESGHFDVNPPGFLFTQSNLRNPRQWTPR